MIKLNKLTFNNINSFVEEQVIDFTEKGRLVRIAGRSGAGKSSIFQAIMYVFKICSKASTILQSRSTKKGSYAILELEVNGELVILSRSKKEGLSISYPNNPEKNLSGNSSITEEHLDQLIGIPRDMFKKLILKKQKDNGFFLKMTTKEMFKFVSDILDVSEENKKIEKITKQISSIKTELKFKDDRMTETTKDLQVLNNKMIETKKNAPTLDPIDEGEVDKLEQSKGIFQKELESLNINKENELSSISKPTVVGVNLNKDDLYNAKKELEEKELEANCVFAKLNTKIDELTEQKNKLQKEIDFLDGPYKQETIRLGGTFQEKSAFLLKLQESKWPTFLQQWTGEDLNNQINITNQEILNIKKDLIERQGKLGTLNDLVQDKISIQAAGKAISEKYNDTLAIYNPILDTLKANITKEDIKIQNAQEEVNQKNLATQNEYNQKKLEIKNKYTSRESELQSKINKISGQIFEIKNTIKDNSNKIEQYNLNLKHCEDNVEQMKDKLHNLSIEKNKLNKQYLLASESQRALKGFILSIFTDFLDTIGDKASEIISSVPNMVNAHIMFDGCKETKTGVMKDEITPIITYGSDVAIPIKSLSGGEETSAELAVDLAVIQTVEEFKNKGADFFIMDEPFGGLGEVDKEIYMNIISEMDLSKRVIIVDHSTELNEMIDDTISVIKDSISSRIEV